MIKKIIPPTTPPAIAPVCESLWSELATTGWAAADVSADDRVVEIGPGDLEADDVVVEDPPVAVDIDDFVADEA